MSMPKEANSISRQIRKFCRFLPSRTVSMAPPPTRKEMNRPCVQLGSEPGGQACLKPSRALSWLVEALGVGRAAMHE